MPFFNRILVPTDLTGSATLAFRHALRLAEKTQAEIHLLHVMEDIGGSGMVGLPPLNDVYERMREVISVEMRLLKSNEVDGDITVKQQIMRGVGAASVILDYIEEEGVDLVVMGTRGRHGGERFRLGSTAEKVVRLAACPVMTVGPRGGWLAGMVRRILVAVDFSQTARATVKWARNLAHHYGARLDLLHVIEPMIQPIFDTERGQVFSFQGSKMDDVRASLKELYEKAGGPQVKVRYHVGRGRPAPQIVRTAREEQSNLIIQGTRGFSNRTGAAMLGTVAEEVVRTAPCPVFTYRVASLSSGRPRMPKSDVPDQVDG